MAGKTFSEDLTKEMTGKAIMWGPAIAGAALLGPVGILVGLVASVVIVTSGTSSSAPPDGGNSAKD